MADGQSAASTEQLLDGAAVMMQDRWSSARRGRPRIWHLAAILAAAFLLACAPETVPPNLIVVSLDTTRSDHSSAYGYGRDTTPELRRIAGEGVLFQQAYATSASTGPTHASLFTGLYPTDHGVVRNGVRLRDRYTTIAERLRDEGFQTAGVAGSFVLHSKFGYSQGFEEWADEFSADRSSLSRERWEGLEVTTEGFDRRADETTRLALDWLESDRNPERPFFLFVHYFDPHAPYDPPASHRRRFSGRGAARSSGAVDRYDEEIAFTDAQVARLMDAVRGRPPGDRPRRRGDTLVVVVGDHGEGLGEHGHMTHGIYVYEEAVRVPLLMWWPGRIQAGHRVEAPISVVDLAPTILGMLGVDTGEPLPGDDLAAAIAGRAELPPTRPVLLYRRHYEPGIVADTPVEGYKLGLRSGRWKVIVGPAEGSLELFDLEADPRESINLAGERPDRVASLLAQLRPYRERADLLAGGEQISPEDRDRLRALGYVR